GEQCDPPNSTTCSMTCQNIAIACGNSIVQPGEQCDPPDNTTCDSSCRNIVCGNSLVQPGEQCDPPTGSWCSTTCQTVPGDPTACLACEQKGTGSSTSAACARNQRCSTLPSQQRKSV